MNERAAGLGMEQTHFEDCCGLTDSATHVSSALDVAKKAVEIDPGNEEYRRLLEQLQSGGDFYDDYTVHYHRGISPDRLCMAMCVANACLGPMCGGRVFCC